MEKLAQRITAFADALPLDLPEGIPFGFFADAVQLADAVIEAAMARQDLSVGKDLEPELKSDLMAAVLNTQFTEAQARQIFAFVKKVMREKKADTES